MDIGFPSLNLPPAQLRIQSSEAGIHVFDIIRKKFVSLTPEEWVRQHFIHLLIYKLGYPAGLFQVERGHTYFKSNKRSDIVVMNKEGQPLLLVECKAAEIKIDSATLQQLSAYNKTLRARYVAISNGLKHLVWEFTGEAYQPLSDFPPYSS